MDSVRYSLAAILLHWAIALMLAFEIGLGWQLEHLPRGPVLFATYQLHKSIGITILLLSLLRLCLRWAMPRPRPMKDDPFKMRLAAWVHTGLYVFMIGAPLSGWLLVSTAKVKVPTLLFGWLPWPNIPFTAGLPAAVHEAAEGIHSLFAVLGIALFLLHLVGALRHELLLREATLARMLPASMGGASRRLAGAAMLALTLVLGVSLLLGRSIRTGADEETAGNRAVPIESGPAAREK